MNYRSEPNVSKSHKSDYSDHRFSSTVFSSTVVDNYRILVLIIFNNQNPQMEVPEDKSCQMGVRDLMCINLGVHDTKKVDNHCSSKLFNHKHIGCIDMNGDDKKAW